MLFRGYEGRGDDEISRTGSHPEYETQIKSSWALVVLFKSIENISIKIECKEDSPTYIHPITIMMVLTFSLEP